MANDPALLSVDAETAFGRVEWSFLLAVLGIGPKFSCGIQAMYTSPKASVFINGEYSRWFELGRDTPQGCHLSAILFALSLVPLAQKLRNIHRMEGL